MLVPRKASKSLTCSLTGSSMPTTAWSTKSCNMSFSLLLRSFSPSSRDQRNNLVNDLILGVSVVHIVCVIVCERLVLKRTVVGDYALTAWAEVIFRVKWIVFVRSLVRWTWLVSLAMMVLAENLVNSHWSFSIRLLLVKLVSFWSVYCWSN